MPDVKPIEITKNQLQNWDCPDPLHNLALGLVELHFACFITVIFTSTFSIFLSNTKWCSWLQHYKEKTYTHLLMVTILMQFKTISR